MSERVAIVGTAQSWRLAPWNDPGVKILGLNDAYKLRFPRFDAWYDIHPISKFHYPEPGQQTFAHQVPPGHYVRPADHVEWMAKLSVPLWLHEDPPAGWHHAQKFPKAAIEADFGQYMTSTPAWMLAHAIQQGAKEVHIYGIHLATEHEYVEQRPNFEFLIGRVLGPGKVKLHVHGPLRTYETEDGRIVLPVDSPVLQSPFQYAYDTRPASYLEPVKWELHKLTVKHARAVERLKTRKWYQPSTKAQDELWYLEAAIEDARQQLNRLQMGA